MGAFTPNFPVDSVQLGTPDCLTLFSRCTLTNEPKRVPLLTCGGAASRNTEREAKTNDEHETLLIHWLIYSILKYSGGGVFFTSVWLYCT